MLDKVQLSQRMISLLGLIPIRINRLRTQSQRIHQLQLRLIKQMRLHRALRPRQILIPPDQTTPRPRPRPLVDRRLYRPLKHTHIRPHLMRLLNLDDLVTVLNLLLRVPLSLVHLLSDLPRPLLLVLLRPHELQRILLVHRVAQSQQPALKPLVVLHLLLKL